MTIYRLFIDGLERGPYGRDQVTKMLQSGEVTHATSAWKDGLPEWSTLGAMEEFAKVRKATAAAVPSGPVAPQRVNVVGMDIPFRECVYLLLRLVLAAVPALIVAGFVIGAASLAVSAVAGVIVRVVWGG